MKMNFLVILSVLTVIACSTRENRRSLPAGAANGNTSPLGVFQGKPEADISKFCTAIDPKSATIDKDLKSNDQFVSEVSVVSGNSTVNSKHQTDVTSTSATEVKFTNVLIVDGLTPLKFENICKLVSDGSKECWVIGKDGKEDVKAKNSSLEDMPCKISEESQPKIEVFSGPFKLAEGETVNAVRKVETRVGQITCTDKDSGKTLNMGHGRLVLDQYRSADVVNIPGNNKCQEELVFESYQMITDDGKNISTMKIELKKAPIRKR